MDGGMNMTQCGPNKALQPTRQPPLRYGWRSAELGRYAAHE